jgi:chaperonin GroES
MPDNTPSNGAPQTTAPRFVPRSNRIVLKPDPIKDREGLIWFPDQAKERLARERQVHTGKIVSLGPGSRTNYSGWRGYHDEHGVSRWPMPPVKLDSHVIYRTWAGHEAIIDGEPHRIVSDDSIDAELCAGGAIKLFWDRLLVRRVARADATKGGIIIPGISKKTPLEGEVVQIGPGMMLRTGRIRPMDVRVGDRVVWRPMKGVSVTEFVTNIYDGDIVMLFEDDLVGVAEGAHAEPAVSMRKEE